MILVTWNNHADVVECLEALLRSDYDAFTVVVCDNASADGTLAKLQAWAEAPDSFQRPSVSPLGAAAAPLDPIPFVVHDRATAERGGGERDADVALIFVQTGANLGYAGGNNVGLTYALARGDAGYLWLLNGDTVVPPDCMSRLVAFAGPRPEVGLVGSPLIDYDDPTVLQAYGGAVWDQRRAAARRIGEGQPAGSRPPLDRLDLIVGVSMFASAAWVRSVGLLEDRYFLYCEEIDWATRGTTQGSGRLQLAVAPDAPVFHKSRTAGKSGWSWRRWYYFQRARVLFTARFYPQYVPTVVIGVAGAGMHRLRVLLTYVVASTVKTALRRIRDLGSPHRISPKNEPDR